MDEKTLKNATVPFFTTKEEGTDVGLSLVRQLMTVLNGKLQITSKLGEGTKVELVF